MLFRRRFPNIREYANSSPNALSAAELATLGKGEKRVLYKGCCPSGALYSVADSENICKSKGFSYPQTGEFSFQRGDECLLCPFAYGDECDKGISGGTRPAVVRNYFGGDQKQCCLNQPYNHLIGDKACDPALTINCTDCFPYFKDYCSQGDNIFTDSKCQQWADKWPTNAWTIKKGMCSSDGAIQSNQNCRNFIISQGRQDSMNNMDGVMYDFCSRHPTDSLCTCIKSPSDIPCPNKFNKDCVASGYVPYTMQTAPCPDYIDCKQYVNITDKALVVGTKIEQNCQMTKSDNGQPAPYRPTDDEEEESTTDAEGEGLTFLGISIWWIVAILIFILLIIVGMTIWFVVRKK